jgi:hypothetical protein
MSSKCCDEVSWANASGYFDLYSLVLSAVLWLVEESRSHLDLVC